MVKGKKKLFVEAYVNDVYRNQTAAAIAAGYSEKTAAQAASRLMKDEDVAAAIAEREKELHEKNTAKADEVIEFLTAVMRGEEVDNILRLKNDGAQEITESPPPAKDRIKAAELLGKYYTLFTDKTQVDGDMNFSVQIDYGGDDGDAEDND
ncbi:MAG: terminase small subunit [Oscillospiraceae bacterium]|nr:terminase small subunit [Oscillospiraceae bacterium]